MALRKKKFFFWLKLIVTLYCLIGIILYYVQDKFLFHPEKLPRDYRFDTPFLQEEVFLPMNKTDTVHILKLKPATSAKGLVLYYHGNMKNAGYYLKFVTVFLNKGYEVWMPDYPGFGKSTGELTEKKLYDHAWQVQQLAKTHYDAAGIIVYGKSLGTGIAAYTASVLSCRLLILETPYYSLADLFSFYAFMYPVSMMGRYTVPTWEFLDDVKAPVRIIHGTKDNIIPYSEAEKLKEYLKPGDRFITVAGGRHNDITTKALYLSVIDSL